MWLKRVVKFTFVFLIISGSLFGQELIKKSNKKQVIQQEKEHKKTEKNEDAVSSKNKKKKEHEQKIEKKSHKTKKQISIKKNTSNSTKHKKTPAFDSKLKKSNKKSYSPNSSEIKKQSNPQIYQKKKTYLSNKKKPYVTKKKIYHGNQGAHSPSVVIEKQHVTYSSPQKYHYYVPPRYIYRGLWIRYYIDLPNGYVFYNGYPYYVYHNYLYRYSVEDPGSFDLVDSWTDETYATFYGESLKESYDRCADLRDMLNSEYGEERYFCAERFEYDSNYKYGWDPDDYPDWYWY